MVLRGRGVHAPGMRPALRSAAALLAACLALAPATATAYAPGSGTLFTDGFQDGNDDGWQAIGIQSRWTVADRGGSRVYLADTAPDLFRALPESARRPSIAVPVGSVDLCLQLRPAGGTGYEFRADLRPPRDEHDFIRLLVAADGRAEVQLVTSSGPRTIAATAPGLVAMGAPSWMRLQVRPGAGASTDVSFRAWTGGAAAEPAAGWDATGSTPGSETMPSLQRLEIAASQPAGETWIDQLDVFGDTSAGVLSGIDTVWIVEASHLDIGFTAPPDEIETFAKTHLDQVLGHLRTTPDYRWNLENSWWLLRWMERSSPAEIQEMFDFARAGRVSLAAGYVNLHSTVTSREELIRSLTYSRSIARAEGIPVRTYIHDDVPGATWAMPEILAQSGVEHFVGGMNCFIGGAVRRPSHADRPFWWQGPDGSRVLSWVTFDSYAEGLGLYGMSFFHRLADLHQGLGAGLAEQERLGYPHRNLMVMRVFDNHYQGLHVRNLVEQWNARYASPRLRLASADEFFDAVRAEIAASGWTIPTFTGDFGSAWTSVIPGTAHTQREASDARRDLEAAETFAAAAWALGDPHPTGAIDLAWRRILDVDEHSGGGAPWPGYMTPEETDRQSLLHQGYAAEARSNAASAVGGALASLSARVELPRGGIVVWNAEDSPRTDVARATLPPAIVPGTFRLVDASRGEEIPYQPDAADPQAVSFLARDVPPRGWRAYRLLRGRPSPPPVGSLVVGATSIENAHFRVEVDPADGSVISLVDRASGREWVDGSSAHRFGQSASNTNSSWFWGAAPEADVPSSASVTPGAAGPVTASLVVTREGTPAARMEIRLHEGLDVLEIASTFDRSRCRYVPQSDGSRMWALTFPLALSSFRFGTESPARFLRPDEDGFERDQLFSSMNSLAAVDAEDATGALILASPEAPLSEWGGISNMIARHRTDRGLWMLRVKNVADEALWEDQTIGTHDDEPGLPREYPVTVRLRTRPAGLSEGEIRRRGRALVDPLRAVFVPAGSGELPAGGRALFASPDPGARVVTVKRSADGASLVARLEDMEGASRDAALLARVISLESPAIAGLVDEQPVAPATVTGGGVLVPLRAHGTTTIAGTPVPRASPTLLFVRKDPAADSVELTWEGGTPGYRVLRSLRRDLAGDTAIAADGLEARAHSDRGVLTDRATYFYDIQ